MKDSDPILGHKSRLAEDARQRVIDKEIVANTWYCFISNFILHCNETEIKIKFYK